MHDQDALQQAFLDELRELEVFRAEHAAAHPTAPLEREDPDLRRLLEAVAFFSARTHRAALASVTASQRRIFQQLLPHAVSPLPAMGLVTARPAGRFVEALDLPRGTELVLRGAGGAQGLFRTVHDLRVLPLTVSRVSTVPGGGGARVVVRLETPVERRDEVGALALHVNALDALEPSLRLFQALQASTHRVAVAWDCASPEDAAGIPCEFTFGAPPARERRVREPVPSHPVEQARRALRLPEAELFLNVDVPRPPGAWRRLALLLDLDAGFPRELWPGRGEPFRLFTTPVVNLVDAAARPALFDGTAERLRLRHPDPSCGLALHSVTGVYRVEGGVSRPLRPALLGGAGPTFELELADDGEEKGHWLHLHVPEAFEAPCTIAVEGLWHQPGFSRALEGRVEAALRKQQVPGLRWEVSGAIAPAVEGVARHGMDALLQTMALQKRSRLALDELSLLLDVVGGAWAGPYARLRPLLAGVRVTEAVLPQRGARGASELTYHLAFRSLETCGPLAASFAVHVQRLLDAWISDAAVVVGVEEPS